MKSKKIFYSLVLLIIALFTITKTVQAADIRIADKNNGNVNIEQNENVKNLYSIGDVVSINSKIEKSVYSLGNVLNINEPVSGDVNSISNTLIIKNNVGGTIHAIAKNIIIEGKISDDLFAIGTGVLIDSKSSIGGDAFLIGDNINIQGPISGSVNLIGNTIVINSEISGDVKIKEASSVTLGSKAVIKGNLEYASNKEIEIQNGATVAGSIIDNSAKTTSTKEKFNGFLAVMFSIAVLIKIVGLVILGLILVYLFKKFTSKSVDEVFSNFWKNLGIGFASLILTPIIAILLMVSIVGLWLGFIVIMLYVISIFLAITLSTIILGSWLMKVIKKEKENEVSWKELVLGVIVFILIGFIPVIGQLAVFILLLLSLGVVYKTIFNLHK